MKLGLILSFSLINLINYMDRYILVAVLPNIREEFKLDYVDAGALSSAFVIGYLVFSPIFGYLGDRYSRGKLMFIGVFIWSFATLLTALCETYNQMFLTRILVGIGEASFSSIAPGYIKDRVSIPSKVNFSLSIFFAAIPVGTACGYLLGSEIGYEYGWRTVFYIGCMLGIVFSPILLFIREVERGARLDQASHQKSNLLASFKGDLVSILTKPTLRNCIIGYTLNNFALVGIATFITSYGSFVGVSDKEITKIFGLIIVVGGFVGTLSGSYLSNFFAHKKNNGVEEPEESAKSFMFFSSIACFIASPIVLLGFMSSSSMVLYACCLTAIILVFQTTGPANSTLTLCAPQGLITLTQGFAIFCLNLFGSLLSPILLGVVANNSASGLQTGLQLTAPVLLINAYFWLRASRLNEK